MVSLKLQLPWVGLLALLLSSCNLADGFTDLGDGLLNPDASLLDRPGRQILEGRFSNIVLDGSLENGGYVLALRRDGDVPSMTIVPFVEGGGDPCEISPAHYFERLSSRVDLALSGIVAVNTTGEAGQRGTIRFVDFNCQDRIPAIEDATLPRIEFPLGMPRGLLSITGSRQLYLANAETASLDFIAENVSLARVSSHGLWTLERGKLLLRDAQLKIVVELGDEVVDFVVTESLSPEVLFQDREGVHLWSSATSTTTLAQKGCQPTVLGSAFAFFAPCETRRLQLELQGSLIGSKRERVRVIGPENVILPSSVQLTYSTDAERTRLLLLTSTDPAATIGTLHVAEILGKEHEDAEAITLEPQALAERVSLGPQAIYVNWDGVRGDLKELELDETGKTTGLRLLATGVAQLPGQHPFSNLGVLARYGDDQTGDLIQLKDKNGEIEETLLAEQVPIQAQSSEKDGSLIAFVGDLEEGAGSAYILNGSTTHIVGERAYPNTLRFLEQPRALAYLAATSKRDSSRLVAYLIDSDLEVSIQDNVSEYRIVPWPSPGLLYSVSQGKNAGLWFSKAR